MSGSSRICVQDELRQVTVWINLENCRIPAPIQQNACNLSCNINRVLQRLGYQGSVSIFAYGDAKLVHNNILIALQHSGVTFVDTHTHHTGPNAADRKMLVDIGFWAFDNPIPNSLLIISADRGLWPIMENLKAVGHNVIMACPDGRFRRHPPADTILNWEELVRGNPVPAELEI